MDYPYPPSTGAQMSSLDPGAKAILSPNTPLDTFDQILASLNERVSVAANRLSNRADRLFGYNCGIPTDSGVINPDSVSQALSILGEAVSNLEAQINRFY